MVLEKCDVCLITFFCPLIARLCIFVTMFSKEILVDF